MRTLSRRHALAAAAGLVASAGPAFGFFFPVPPGPFPWPPRGPSDPPRRSPDDEEPRRPPPDDPRDPKPPPDGDDGDPRNPPLDSPEPSTLVLGALGALASARYLRGRRVS